MRERLGLAISSGSLMGRGQGLSPASLSDMPLPGRERGPCVLDIVGIMVLRLASESLGFACDCGSWVAGEVPGRVNV